jgi:hypothetical protein
MYHLRLHCHKTHKEFFMKRFSIMLVVGIAMFLLPVLMGCAASTPNNGHPRIPLRPYIDPSKLAFKDSKGVVHQPSQATLDAVAKLNALRAKQAAAPPPTK